MVECTFPKVKHNLNTFDSLVELEHCVFHDSRLQNNVK